MIFESLIRDDGWLTIECAKAMIKKGSQIYIADELYWEKEIQSAISGGWMRPLDTPPAKTRKEENLGVRPLKNMRPHKITLDCIQDYAEKDEYIMVPEEKMGHSEVIWALRHGWLSDESGKSASFPMPGNLSPAEQEIIAARANRAPRQLRQTPATPQRQPEVQAPRPISAFDDVQISDTEEPNPLLEPSELEGDNGVIKARRVGMAEESRSSRDLFAPSQVIVPKDTPLTSGGMYEEEAPRQRRWEPQEGQESRLHDPEANVAAPRRQPRAQPQAPNIRQIGTPLNPASAHDIVTASRQLAQGTVMPSMEPVSGADLLGDVAPATEVPSNGVAPLPMFDIGTLSPKGKPKAPKPSEVPPPEKVEDQAFGFADIFGSSEE